MTKPTDDTVSFPDIDTALASGADIEVGADGVARRQKTEAERLGFVNFELSHEQQKCVHNACVEYAAKRSAAGKPTTIIDALVRRFAEAIAARG